MCKKRTLHTFLLHKMICYYVILLTRAVCLMVSQNFSSFFNMSLWEQMTPRTWPIWTSGAWLARFMQGITKHCYIRNILDVGPMVLEGFFPIYSQWTIMTPRVWTNFDPRGMVARIYVGDHWTLLYIKCKL